MIVPMPGDKEYVRRKCRNCGFIFDGRGSCPKCKSNATDPMNRKPLWSRP